MKKPYTNATSTVQHIGSVTLQPGETRPVDDWLLPPEEADQPAQLEPADPLLPLLDGTVETVTEALSGLSHEDLEALEALEALGKNRKGVMEAIAAERLRRAAA